VNGADLQRARQLAEEMRGLGEDSGDAAARFLSHQASNYTYYLLGDFSGALEDLEQGLALFDPADRLFYAAVLPYDPLVVLLAASSSPLVCLGHHDQAVSRRDAAIAEARRLSHPLTLAVALGLSWIASWCARSDPNWLLPYADELLALAAEHRFGFQRTLGLIRRGWCLAALGRAEEGIPLLSGSSTELYDGGFKAHRPFWLTLLADACRMAGQWQSALGHLAEARRFAEETGDRWALAETLRLIGEVLLATSDRVGAEAAYREALALAQRQSAKLWELRTATSLARLWRDQGKRAEALALLAPVYGWFTEGLDTPVLREAKTLVEELAAAPNSAARGGM
jgi:predicted ATPase